MDPSKIVFLINDKVRLIRVSYDSAPMPGEKLSHCNFKTLDQSVPIEPELPSVGPLREVAPRQPRQLAGLAARNPA